ncbi:MAG: thioredoxin domain-containing protein [Candidatus Dormibacteria bacterium]|jgi:uncharacterized protein YyaL (SSP411 family)
MANRLATQSSPYLRQHAGNPVDWYPWGEEAMTAARDGDRPILLSVGYSACHWCHVMAHECFEAPAIAALMNELFVNVKVDREERPDLDAVYMEAVQAMTGQGGWPMTVFLTPDGAPYFGGTYFPPVPRGGLPAFPAVLRAAHGAYRQDRQGVLRIGDEIRRALAPAPLPVGDEPSADVVTRAVARLVEQSDTRHGGFGGAPKFPHPAALELLLRRGFGGADPDAAVTARTTLDGMLRGGIFDQLGGGFHRYSVDAGWAVPHFEKMLYDNAQLAVVYLHAHQLTGDSRYRRAVELTLDYLIREMRLPEGGFASSQDADSEGVEGRCFVWTPEQIRVALADPEEGALACRVFGVSERGNFEGGSSVPSLALAPEELAAELGIAGDDAALRLDLIRRRLLSSRSQRIAPGRDSKVVTAWNGLALRALAEAGSVLARQDYVEIARNCADFLLEEVVVEGRLRRSWMAGTAGVNAFLEDVTFLGDGLLAVYEATGEARHYERAAGFAEEIEARFRGPDGGCVDTAADAEPLLIRPRGLEDNPLPAGRSMAAQLFLRLAGLTGEERWRDRAREIVRPLVPAIARAPLALGSLACVLDQLVAPSREVAIVGPTGDDATRALLREVWGRRDPYRALAWGAGGSVPLLAGRSLVDGRPAAHVCEGFVCRLPTTDPGELAAQLAAVAGAAG